MDWFGVDNKTILLFEIRNSNIDYGADLFFTNFKIYNKSNEEIKNTSKKYFIYAGEVKTGFEFFDVDNKDINNVEIMVSDILWKSKNDFPQPETEIREIKTEAVNNDGTGITVSGIVKNKNSYPLSFVKIIAVVNNHVGIRLSASKAELQNIGAFEDKSFSVIFPQDLVLLSNSSAYKFSRDLTINSKGEDVLKLQQFLKDAGFYNGAVSGTFNQETKTSLTNYQKSFNLLPANGYFNVKTRNYINALPPSVNLNEADSAKTKIYVEALR